jgi:hypothetical protein
MGVLFAAEVAANGASGAALLQANRNKIRKKNGRQIRFIQPLLKICLLLCNHQAWRPKVRKDPARGVKDDGRAAKMMR